MFNMAFYRKRICEYETQNNLCSLELFSFVKQLAGLIEEHLDTNWQALKSTNLPSQFPA